MLLGIISDIHADEQALRIALDLLVRHGVDRIVCLGDVVEKGTGGDACVELLNRWLIPCVRGNHDEIASFNQDLTDDDPRWQILQPATLDYLVQLPLTRYTVCEGWRVLMCHGSPADVWEYLHPDLASAKRLKQIAAESDADIILCGHSHRPMDVTYHGVRFLNPGSICGTYTQGSRTCAVLSLPDGMFKVLDLP